MDEWIFNYRLLTGLVDMMDVVVDNPKSFS